MVRAAGGIAGCRRASTTTTCTRGTSSATPAASASTTGATAWSPTPSPPCSSPCSSCSAARAGFDDPRFLRARDAYLEVFADLAPRAELVETLELACHVAKIARALTWDRALRAARDQGEPGEDDSPSTPRDPGLPARRVGTWPRGLTARYPSGADESRPDRGRDPHADDRRTTCRRGSRRAATATWPKSRDSHRGRGANRAPGASTFAIIAEHGRTGTGSMCTSAGSRTRSWRSSCRGRAQRRPEGRAARCAGVRVAHLGDRGSVRPSAA